MMSIPRIMRATPRDDVIHPGQPIPIWAGLRWHVPGGWGQPQDVEAVATAWSGQAVQIVWTWDGGLRSDWVDSGLIRRR